MIDIFENEREHLSYDAVKLTEELRWRIKNSFFLFFSLQNNFIAVWFHEWKVADCSRIRTLVIPKGITRVVNHDSDWFYANHATAQMMKMMIRSEQITTIRLCFQHISLMTHHLLNYSNCGGKHFGFVILWLRACS